MANNKLVKTTIVDKNGIVTTRNKKAGSDSGSSRIAKLHPEPRWVDENGYGRIPEYPDAPHPQQFVNQHVEQITLRGNYGVKITFPDADKDYYLYLIADPGDGGYYKPAILTFTGELKDEAANVEDYIIGGQANYGSPPIVKDVNGNLLISENDNYIPLKQRSSVATKEGVYEDRLEDNDLYATDRYGNGIDVTALSHLDKDTENWLTANAPVYIPKKPEPTKWVGSTRNSQQPFWRD